MIAQLSAAAMPVIVEKGGRHCLMVDGKPFLILGGQAHNSSAWPAMLPKVWEAIGQMHANTLEIPIYWEQVEARQGSFDFSLIDTLLLQARAHRVRLVLLWFATWKNGSNHYMPEWMKRDAARYPNIQGRDGKPVDSPAPEVSETLEADIRAFAAVMRHLKEADIPHTVIMVQIENEPGSWNSVRNFSANAQRRFDGPVPDQLLKAEILEALHVPVVSGGSWEKVFGARADEYFQAWSIARFIDRVAEVGKTEYPLPVYVNAALRDPLSNPDASSYESGGPTDNVIPIWKAAAPSIDVLAPDIYLSGSERVLKVLDLYDRPDNPLFVPEAGLLPENAKYLYGLLGHGGIGFSPFGIDDNGHGETQAEMAARLGPFAQEFAMAAPMMRELAKWAFEGKIKAVVEREDHADQTIDLGDWQAVVSFGEGRGNAWRHHDQPRGKALIVLLDKNKFMLVGTDCRISFRPLGQSAGRAWQYLRVEEGSYAEGVFRVSRILNGDETDWGGPLFSRLPVILQATLTVR
jgi:Domain of unknown function (DUF5597)/Glycosyl hydrolases family 35